MKIGDKNVHILGDPHLGKRFIHNVPLHRRGDRERMMREKFRGAFSNLGDIDIHVCMGDLFDRPIVGNDDVLFVADTYQDALMAYPNTTFIILAGNHDISKDLTVVNSFDVLERILAPKGVKVVKTEPLYLNDMGFFPWSPVVTATEMAAKLSKPLLAAFGHWDVVNPVSGRDLVPIHLLDTSLIITGHDHNPRTEGKLIVVGSMQPMAHGQGDLYRTLTLEQLASIPREVIHDLCLRIILKKDEEVPPDLDALEIQVIREGEKLPDDIDLNVNFGELNIAKLFTETFSELGVSENLRKLIYEKYQDRS